MLQHDVGGLPEELSSQTGGWSFFDFQVVSTHYQIAIIAGSNKVKRKRATALAAIAMAALDDECNSKALARDANI